MDYISTPKANYLQFISQPNTDSPDVVQALIILWNWFLARFVVRHFSSDTDFDINLPLRTVITLIFIFISRHHQVKLLICTIIWFIDINMTFVAWSFPIGIKPQHVQHIGR